MAPGRHATERLVPHGVSVGIINLHDDVSRRRRQNGVDADASARAESHLTRVVGRLFAHCRHSHRRISGLAGRLLQREHLREGVIGVLRLFQGRELRQLRHEGVAVHGLGGILICELRGQDLEELILSQLVGSLGAGRLLRGLAGAGDGRCFDGHADLLHAVTWMRPSPGATGKGAVWWGR